MPTILKGINLEDRIEVPTQRRFTDAGQMIVPCAFARTGSMNYTAAQLRMNDRKPDEIIAVFRDEADVFDEDSVASFRSAPVTIGHPRDEDGKNINITADNASELQVGMLEGLPVRDEDLLSGTLIIANQKAIDLIVDEEVTELSAGYTCDLEVVVTDDGTKIYQRNIRANHIAIVPKGRAGAHVRIADEEDENVDTTKAATDEDVAKANLADGSEGNKEEAGSVDKSEVSVTDDKSYDDYDIMAVRYSLADELVAVSDYEGYIAECRDEGLKSILAEILTDEKDHVRKLTGWIASKVSGMTNDEAETQVKSKSERLTISNASLDDALEKLKTIEDSNSSDVKGRVSVIMSALDATHLKVADFDNKSNLEVKKLVLADRLPNLSLDDKTEGYIDARFDMVCDDDSGESEMAKELRKSVLVADASSKPKMGVVEAARQKSIARHKNRN